METKKEPTEWEKLVQDTKSNGILIWPDEHLKTSCHVLSTEFTEEMGILASRLKKACNAVGGIGMSAPQLGENLQLSILNIPDEEPLTFWNPEIIPMGGSKRKREGCLSMPGVFGEARRFKKITLRAQTPAGPIIRTFGGLMAQAIQHECNHLDGDMFFEYSKPAERKQIIKDHEDGMKLFAEKFK